MQVEVLTYQGFLQQTVRLFGLGYYHYSLTLYPKQKETKWPGIDDKIVAKYPLFDLDKYQRARRKKRGLLNAHFIRFNRFALMLRTTGADDCDLLTAEQWQDVRRSRLVLPGLWQDLDFAIVQPDGVFTVTLDKPCWHRVKDYYVQIAKSKVPVPLIVKEFERLDLALPSWRGLYRQKRALAKLLVTTLRQAGRHLTVDGQRRPVGVRDFRVTSTRPVVRVWTAGPGAETDDADAGAAAAAVS